MKSYRNESVDPVSGLTDREAFELMVKYGSEKSLSLINEMILVAGIETAINNIIKVYETKDPNTPEEMKQWIRQGVRFLHNKNQSNVN